MLQWVNSAGYVDAYPKSKVITHTPKILRFHAQMAGNILRFCTHFDKNILRFQHIYLSLQELRNITSEDGRNTFQNISA